MDFPELTAYAVKALHLVLFASLPPVLMAATIGVLISLIQALTQIQEQTLAFGFKLIAVILTLLATMQTIASMLLSFAKNVFDKAAIWSF